MNTTLLRFFRHQFTSPPLTRLFWMVPVGVMFTLGATRTDHLLTAVTAPALVTVFVIGALSMEQTAYAAYGMPRGRRLRLAAMAVVPAVVTGSAVALLLRPDGLGVLGALGALAIGLLMGQRYVTGEVPGASERVRSRLGSRYRSRHQSCRFRSIRSLLVLSRARAGPRWRSGRRVRSPAQYWALP